MEISSIRAAIVEIVVEILEWKSFFGHTLTNLDFDLRYEWRNFSGLVQVNTF